MHYLTIEEARPLAGLRLVLTANVPGPWSQAAKSVFNYRKVAYAPVAQSAAEDNAELVAWTGRRNAPVAIYNDEPPCDGWLDILMLAERLGCGPSLLPTASRDRALCIGLSAEICGPWGLGWCRRISMWRLSGPPTSSKAAALRLHYGDSPEAAAAAPARMRQVLTGLREQLRMQLAAGHDYLFGPRPTACDFYWTAFSIMFDVPEHLANRIPPSQQAFYSTVEPLLAGVVDDDLLRHRDRMFERHIGLPLEF